MKLSIRLLSLASFITKNSIVADIGTDHGYIPMYLIENHISKYVIATDVSIGSLNKTISYINDLEFKGKVEARLGNGLEVIKPFEVDTVVIAGMGGLLIRDILDKDINISNSITNFVLQPMIAVKELREYLFNNHYKIVDEDLVKEDNKYYEIIYAKKGKDFIDKEIYFEISQRIIEKKHPLLKEFINHKIAIASNILNNLEDKTSEKSKNRYEELNKLIKEYKEVLVIFEG